MPSTVPSAPPCSSSSNPPPAHHLIEGDALVTCKQALHAAADKRRVCLARCAAVPPGHHWATALCFRQHGCDDLIRSRHPCAVLRVAKRHAEAPQGWQQTNHDGLVL